LRDFLLLERGEPIATLGLNAPGIEDETTEAFADAGGCIAAAWDVRVAILTGAGTASSASNGLQSMRERSGMLIAEIRDGDGPSAKTDGRAVVAAMKAMPTGDDCLG